MRQFSKNWKHFNLDNYIFKDTDGNFTMALPKKNIKSLINNYYKKNYGSNYGDNIVNIYADLDRDGNMIKIALNLTYNRKSKYKITYDSIFNLYKYPPLEATIPETEFQKDILKEVKKLKKWDRVFINNTSISVPFRKHLQFQKIKDTIVFYLN